MIAATSADETNLLCCLTARKMNPKIHTIARVRNPEYIEQQFAMRGRAWTLHDSEPGTGGGAQKYTAFADSPPLSSGIPLRRARRTGVELKVQPGSRLVGIPLSEMNQIAGVKVLVCAVTRGSETLIPNGSYVCCGRDHIHVTAQADDLARFMKNLQISTHLCARP